MGMPEQQIAHAAIQQVASDPGVSWEIFKYAIGLVLAYITGAYGLMWKLFMLFRQDRDKLSSKIEEVKVNDIKHLEDRVSTLERREE